MRNMKAILMGFGGILAAGLISVSGSAVACTNDVDCPNPACGGEVCSWATATHTCVPAGTAAQGSDGWCSADTDCKCHGEGATCVGVHCSFTLPPAGTTGGTTGAGTTGGASTGTTGGGSTTGAGTTGGTTTGAQTTTAGGNTSTGGAYASSGGCSTSGGSGGLVLGLGLLAGLAFMRRRL